VITSGLEVALNGRGRVKRYEVSRTTAHCSAQRGRVSREDAGLAAVRELAQEWMEAVSSVRGVRCAVAHNRGGSKSVVGTRVVQGSGLLFVLGSALV
jgi:hypothetical protein